MHSARFVDQSPAEVYAPLLEEQTYLCSPRTMYRVLAEADEVRERRDQVRHPAYVKPELVATAPNQVWSWDITKARTLSCRRTSFARNRWHDSRVQCVACLPSLIHGSAVPRLL